MGFEKSINVLKSSNTVSSCSCLVGCVCMTHRKCGVKNTLGPNVIVSAAGFPGPRLG